MLLNVVGAYVHVWARVCTCAHANVHVCVCMRMYMCACACRCIRLLPGHARVDEGVDGWMGGRVDGLMNGWIDGCMDVYMCAQILKHKHVSVDSKHTRTHTDLPRADSLKSHPGTHTQAAHVPALPLSLLLPTSGKHAMRAASTHLDRHAELPWCRCAA